MVRPRTFDEAQVLDVAREQFWDAGYAATRLDDLMGATGLGKGSLYGAFGDKRALFLRVIDAYIDDSHEQLRHVLQAPRAIDALRSVLEAPIDAGAAPEARRGCLLANSVCELGRADAELLGKARDAYETTTGLITGCVVRARDQGDLSATTDPRSLARALLAAQQGVVYMTRTGLAAEELAVTTGALAAHLLPS